MTVLKETRDMGSYQKGYDAGMNDRHRGQAARYRTPRRSDAAAFKFGYADGYQDASMYLADAETNAQQ